MEDVLTEPPPPSRFFDEDLDTFATPSAPPPPHPILLLPPNPNPELLLIAISAPSIAVVHRFRDKTLIGSLILPELSLSGTTLSPTPRDRCCAIYAVDQPPGTFVVATQVPVSAERSRAVAKVLINGIPADSVVALDSVHGANYRGARVEGGAAVFKLETSEQKRLRQGLVDIPWLPSGSVADGLGAAVMAECQMRRRPATLLTTWPENGRQAEVERLIAELTKGFGLDVGDGGGSSKVVSGLDSDLYT